MRVLFCTKVQKKKELSKKTTSNKLYKWARRTRALEEKYGSRWCTVCRQRCMGPYNKQKRNDGKKPRYKNIDRRSIKNLCWG